MFTEDCLCLQRRIKIVKKTMTIYMGEAIKLKDVRTAVIEHIKLEAVGCKHAVIFKDTVCLSKNK